jgi:hypothetical protein
MSGIFFVHDVSTNITYHLVPKMNNTTVAIIEKGTDYPVGTSYFTSVILV